MNKRMQGKFALPILLIGLLPLKGKGQADGYSPMKVSISAPVAAYKIGGVIALHVQVENASSEIENLSMPHGLGLGERMFRYDVFASSGNPVPRWRDLRPDLFVRPETGPVDSAIVVLRPGEVFKRVVFVNTIFDISKPGEYTARISYLDKAVKTYVPSNTITFIVSAP